MKSYTKPQLPNTNGVYALIEDRKQNSLQGFDHLEEVKSSKSSPLCPESLKKLSNKEQQRNFVIEEI